MKKAALITLGLATLTTFVGLSGLDGSTPVQSAVISVTGMLMFLAGITLYEGYKEKRALMKKVLRDQERRRQDFIKVWEYCRIPE